MTANDIAVIADAFGLPSPFEYVQNAHKLAETGEAELFLVAPPADDYDISEDPGEFGLAAKKAQNPGG
jgi:hypothetical protein